jgi:hypothetical protein
MAKKPTSVKSSVKQPTTTAKNRLAKIVQAPGRISNSEGDLKFTLKILLDQSAPVPTRLSALASLQAASFEIMAFENSHSEYVAALRHVASDPDPEIRQRALGMLARNQDPFAQKLLIEGLKQPTKALIPTEKALQLLSYDLHSEAYPLARSIAKGSSNVLARREALRLLASDTDSIPEFEKILLNKKESVELRQIAAVALNSLQPRIMQKHARKIVLDKSEDNQVQTFCLTALTHFGEAATLEQDVELQSRVRDLAKKPGTQLKQSTRAFAAKYQK